MNTSITKLQIPKIWAKARDIGLDREALYTLVQEVSGSRSISGLTKYQGITLINRLEGFVKESWGRKKKKRRAPVPSDNPKVIHIVSMDQVRLIECLRKKAGWDKDHLMSFILKQFKRDNIRKLRNREAGVVISILKKNLKKIKEAV